MKINNLALAIAACFSVSAFALDPFVVKSIRILGVQRTDEGTVFNYLPIRVGDRVDEDKATGAVKALFATGFFRDIRLEAEGDDLVVHVSERPTIFQININGAQDFDKDQLRKALKDNGLAESRIFDRAVLDQAEQEIKKQYFARGKYSVDIKSTVTPLERNRVAVNFDISEGEVATIQQINLVGNQTFTESELLDNFVLTSGGWLTWFNKNDQYSKQKLSADLESLRSYYLNRGYLEFNIESTQVAISPDKKKIYITVNLNEGKKYTISDVRIGGEMLVPEEEIRKLIKIQPGDVFSRELINESSTAISDRLGNDGFAFANVNAVPELDKEKQTAAFTFFVDPGRKVYVRRINIAGNTRTRDEVIRRELRQVEGGWYSNSRIRRSKERLDLLGYFSDVNVETPQVPDAADQVDMNISVTEKPTGNVQAGLGYWQGSGMTFQGSISQANIFGSGKALSLGLNTSSTSKTASISYTNPYFTPEGVSRGFDLYLRRYDPSSLQIGQYNTAAKGGALRFGVPLSEYDYVNLSAGYETSAIELESGVSDRIVDFVNTYGRRYDSFPSSVSWTRDGRDSSFYPTRGALRKASLEAGLPGGDLRYYKLNLQQQWFYPLNKTFTFMANGELGVGGGYGGRDMPFLLNYYSGGIGSVRGYRYASLGPKDVVTEDALGGDRRLVANAEILFPMPGLKGDKSVRLSVFADMGGVWGHEQRFAEDGVTVLQQRQQLNLSGLRYSAGFSLGWISPVGPLRFSVAQPYKSRTGDKLEKFQFTMGTMF